MRVVAVEDGRVGGTGGEEGLVFVPQLLGVRMRLRGWEGVYGRKLGFVL